MKKGILIDMGETVVHNGDMNFANSLKKLYNLSNQCNTSENEFIDECLKILNEIFSNREFLEFKMIDYIKFIINKFNLFINKSVEELEEIFAFNSSEVFLVNNIILFLEYLKNKNYPIIMLSNTSFSKNVVCKILGPLTKYFDEIIVSSECVFRKPHKHFFECGIEKFSNNVNEIYYIGNDFYYDVYGSYNSNLKAIWFNENHLNKDSRYDVNEYIEIDNYKQLMDMDF